jgi:alpha-galactosidase
MEKPKFVLIGAGSSSFTTTLLCGLLRSDASRGATVALVDVNAETLGIVEKLARKIVAQEGRDIEIVASTERRDLLEGADYVTTTISVGGDEAWANDVRIPAAHGIITSVGDSVGIGGMSRAFRHVPVLVDIARDMEELCPDATLYNYTNPMTVNCRAVTRETSIRCVGLCIGAELLREDLCRIVGANPADTWLWAAGINHFVFAYEFMVARKDAYPLVRARLRQARGERMSALPALIKEFPTVRATADEPCEYADPFCAELFESTGFYPGPGDLHVAEFLPHFFHAREDWETYGLRLLDIEGRRKRTAAFLEKFREAAESPGQVDVGAIVRGTGGEEAQVLAILRAIEEDSREVFFVNLPNRGQIANLPEDAVVEGPAVATQDGLKSLVFGELPGPIAGWTQRWLEWGELVVDAALTGNRSKALHCLAADPGCPGLSRSQVVLDELLAANGKWMKYFAC